MFSIEFYFTSSAKLRSLIFPLKPPSCLLHSYWEPQEPLSFHIIGPEPPTGEIQGIENKAKGTKGRQSDKYRM
jgi:hypothetical protein